MTMQLERSYRPARASATSAIPGSVPQRSNRPAPERMRPRVPARRGPASGLVGLPPMVPAASAVPCAEPRESGYRLGRWARLTITLSVVVLAVLFTTGALPAATTDPPATSQVTVHSGDTLFSIADDAVSGGELGQMVEQIRRLNGLDDLAAGLQLPVGMVLVVPSG